MLKQKNVVMVVFAIDQGLSFELQSFSEGYDNLTELEWTDSMTALSSDSVSILP